MNEIRLTAAWVAAAVAGTIAAGDPDREFGNVSIDTRTIAPGDLFIAIRGERFDGTEFASQAIENGASGVVVPRGWSAAHSAAAAQPFRVADAGVKPRATSAVVIEVDETTAALQALANAIRRASGTKVVAITGSQRRRDRRSIKSSLRPSQR